MANERKEEVYQDWVYESAKAALKKMRGNHLFAEAVSCMYNGDRNRPLTRDNILNLLRKHGAKGTPESYMNGLCTMDVAIPLGDGVVISNVGIACNGYLSRPKAGSETS